MCLVSPSLSLQWLWSLLSLSTLSCTAKNHDWGLGVGGGCCWGAGMSLTRMVMRCIFGVDLMNMCCGCPVKTLSPKCQLFMTEEKKFFCALWRSSLSDYPVCFEIIYFAQEGGLGPSDHSHIFYMQSVLQPFVPDCFLAQSRYQASNQEVTVINTFFFCIIMC